MIKEHENAILRVDLPSIGLMAGDIGVVVHVYKHAKAYEVEFIALDGSTLAVETLDADKIRPIRDREIPHVREIAAA